MHTITIQGFKGVDDGLVAAVKAAIGFDALLGARGDVVTLAADMTAPQLATAEATIRAYTPDPKANPAAVKKALRDKARTLEGRLLSSLNQKERETLDDWMYAAAGLVGGASDAPTVEIPNGNGG